MLDAMAHTLHVILAGVSGRGSLHDYGGFASAQVYGVGRGRAGESEVSDRTPVCEGRDREPRTPISFCSSGGGSLWFLS
jgi:hypothetical protein